MPGRKEIERLREKYPPGSTVQLLSMEDAQAPEPGTCGRVEGVDDAGNILVRWANGSSLSLVPGVDAFRIS